MPAHGRAADEVIAELAALREHDVNWRDGRTFGLVFDGGGAVHDVAERAALLYLHENALNTAAFPSLGRIQADVVAWTAELLHGTAGTAGFLTSGGTESIQCAVLAARERARDERGITDPVIVVAESAHAAFHKSAHLFGIEIRTAPVLEDWTADVEAMAGLVDERTVLVVGSAPQYPQGVIDPIPEIVGLAATVGAHVHVDACMGGFVLPFAERIGRHVPPWDFRVDGVDSISADVHKLGYAPKGASVIAYRNKSLRRYQTFTFDAWLGGIYASPNLQGTRAGLPMATAWAVMAHLGIDGYVERTRATLAAADDLRAAVTALDGVRVLGDSAFHLVAIASDAAAEQPADAFAVGDGLVARGWHLDRQGPPDALHLTVSAGNVATMPAFVADLQAVVADTAGASAADRSTPYATLE